KRDYLWGGANVEIGDLGLKVEKKGVRLGGNEPVKIVSGGVKLYGGYRALVVFFVVFLALGFT
ncbi:non-race specific disease resistance protein 1-like protein b, partial [Trifolium medium]|nr:non-race specific disease resistance protein 1-like protein b [Trifolium medium]